MKFGKEFTALFFGPSQSGKSTCINTVARDSLAPVGQGNGMSVTTGVHGYQVEVSSDSTPVQIHLLDVQGLNDSNGAKNKYIKQKIQDYILRETEKSHLSAIMLFESLSNDTIHLKNTINHLKSILGPNCLKSVIVIFTKADKCREATELKERKSIVEDLCENENISFLYWENSHRKAISDSKYQTQIDELINKIEQVSPYHLKEVQRLRDEIEERAAELERITPRQRTNTTMELEFPEIRQWQETVPRTFSFQTQVAVPRRSFLGRIFRGPKMRSETQTITTYEEQTRMEVVNTMREVGQEVEVPFPQDFFLERARKEVMEKMKGQTSSLKPKKSKEGEAKRNNPHKDSIQEEEDEGTEKEDN